jgi:hypothetical protein
MTTAVEDAKAVVWGTYGPGAVEAYEAHGTPLPPISLRPLGVLETDHLEAILAHIELHGHGRYGSSRDLLLIAVKLVLEDRRAGN